MVNNFSFRYQHCSGSYDWERRWKGLRIKQSTVFFITASWSSHSNAVGQCFLDYFFLLLLAGDTWWTGFFLCVKWGLVLSQPDDGQECWIASPFTLFFFLQLSIYLERIATKKGENEDHRGWVSSLWTAKSYINPSSEVGHNTSKCD